MSELDPRALEKAKNAYERELGRVKPGHGPSPTHEGCLAAAIRAYLHAMGDTLFDPNLPTGHVSIPIVKPEDVKK